MVTRQRVVVTAFGGAFAHTDLGAAPNIAKRQTTALWLLCCEPAAARGSFGARGNQWSFEMTCFVHCADPNGRAKLERQAK